MGCNTSKEAMQPPPVENNTSGSGSAVVAAAVNATPSTPPTPPRPLTPLIPPTPPPPTEPKMENSTLSIDSKLLEPVGTVLNNTVTPLVEKVEEKVAEVVKRIEVSDIDLNDPEANRAATKIQAAFRGHQTRKNMKQGDGETKANLKEEFSPENKELTEAATKIQASFRGHLVRKSAPRKDEEEEEITKRFEKLDAKATNEEVDIDLSDPDLQVAATKIQASFRGHRVRKEKQLGSDQ